MVININVTNKHAAVVGSPVIVCGNSGYSVAFAFDSEWDTASTKTARFVYIQDGAVKYTDVVFTGTAVEAPILANTKEVRVGVFAGNLQTSTPAVIPCELSIRCGTGAPVDPTPSQYDQIIALLNQGGGGGGGGGAPGATFTPSVDAEGNLSWTNNGGLVNPATVNIKGPKGDTPVKGTDYFTPADQQAIVAAVLASFTDASEVAM